ncbi:uncharacterized protein LOC135214466 isoform X2 [Macrobrachium nipponense]|uniref:uncharacterized protein LOC135214466 isoform X2 n=1 Tax=Macrobrachium nipponense TaxID=159736 RepID=UPI0030C89BC2
MVSGTSTTASHDGPEPEREQLTFEVDTEGFTPETAALVEHIKQVAEDVLYHWKTFPLHLPSHVAVQNDPASTASSGNFGGGGNGNGGGGAGGGGGTGGGGNLVGGGNGGVGLFGRARPLILRDVFVTPSFDELDAVAVDSKGDPRRLSNHHLHSIREKGLHRDSQGKRRRLTDYQLETLRRTGEFEVESLHFPGQSHRWQVSGWLQKGCEKAHDSLLNDVALALSLIVVTAKNRISSPLFSLSQSLHSIWQGMLMLVDLAFGIPWVQAHNLEARMKEERCSYLVQELTCKDGDVESLCSWMVQQIKRATREKFQLSGEKQPPVPYIFTTPQGLELDLRLFNRELMKKALPVLVSILEKEARGWFLHFREKVVADLKAQNLSDYEVEKEGNRLVQEEYLRRVYTAILAHPVLQELGHSVPQLLVNHAKAVLLMHRALDEVERIYEEGERARREELRHTHPIFSRIDSWLADQIRATHETLTEQHKWRPHEHSLALCRQHDLQQHAYFLQRDLSFMREREPVLLNELKNLKVAMRVFQWRAQVWFPSNYIVSRSFQGESEIIPTVLASSPTSITTPRTDPNHPVYLLEKQLIRTTSTRWPFWRWCNFVHRSWAWTCNTLFFFGVWLPLCSPVSLRALLCQEPFMPDFELSQVNGTVCPSKSSLTPTLASRLQTLWRHISKSRSHFETTPDTGFIGKGVTRHMNRAWNYVMKGIVGTLLLTTVFPLTCLLVSMGSMAVAVVAPLWVPALVFLIHISCILLYDVDSPTGKRKWSPILQAIALHLIALGIIQPVLAFITATLICPVVATIVLLYGVVRRGLRHIWDAFMFHAVIKKRGRIPASDSFLVKRIAGPGLHSNFYYQISCEQALAAFEARLELDELSVYQRETEAVIYKPLIVYTDFVQRCFGPFSGIIGKSGNYDRVEKEVRDLSLTLQEKIDRRRRDLALGLPISVRSKVKLTTRDLKITLKQATIMIEEFYPSHVLCRIIGRSSSESSEGDLREIIHQLDRIQGRISSSAPKNVGITETGATSSRRAAGPVEPKFATVEEWWDSKGLAFGDYAGLASLIFTEIFSSDFLTPMEESDTSFQMEVHGVSLSRYTEMIRCLPDRPDLDEKLTVHTPRGNIQVHAPYLDLASFTPLVRHGVPTHRTGKTSLAARLSLRLNPVCGSHVPEKLLIPPPIPHPAHISVIIHNREASETIPLDTPLTLQVIRTIEDSPHVVAAFTSVPLAEDGTPMSDSRSSSMSHDRSFYDDPSLYDGPYNNPSRAGTADRRGTRFSSGRSRTATLEMTATLDRMEQRTNAHEYNRSSTLELTPTRMAQRLPTPLRSFFEGQRPFTVSLNLASAEDVSLEVEEEEEEDPIPLHPLTHSTYTTAV